MNIIIDQVRLEASSLLDSQRRSDLGQYMTPSPIAAFMASLFSYHTQARLLDAGAGVGSLTSAFLEKALQEAMTVDVEAWEIDGMLGAYLKNTLDDYVLQRDAALAAFAAWAAVTAQQSWLNMVLEEVDPFFPSGREVSY